MPAGTSPRPPVRARSAAHELRADRVPDGWFVGEEPVAEVEIVFQIPHVGQAPYAFRTRPVITLVDGATPSNYTAPVSTPWGEDFAQFSWSPLEPWVPKADIRAGANMLNFARSFAERLEGLL